MAPMLSGRFPQSVTICKELFIMFTSQTLGFFSNGINTVNTKRTKRYKNL